MRWRHKVALFFLILVASLVAVLVSNSLISPKAMATEAILQPAPTQPLGYYDYFGKLLTPQQAAQLVRKKGLDPNAPGSYERIGAVHITQQLLDAGEGIFFNRSIGDTGTGRVFGGFDLQPEITKAIRDLHGEQTTNLRITLQKDLKLGSRTYPKGSVIDTGIDVEKGSNVLFGFAPNGGLSCATCHATLSPTGKRLKGLPNGDLNIAFLLAAAPNTGLSGYCPTERCRSEHSFTGRSTGQTLGVASPSCPGPLSERT